MKTVIFIGNKIHDENESMVLKSKHTDYSVRIRDPIKNADDYDTRLFQFNNEMTYRKLYDKLNGLGIFDPANQSTIYFERPERYGTYKEQKFTYYLNKMRQLFEGTSDAKDYGSWHKVSRQEIDSVIDQPYVLVINNDLFREDGGFHPNIKRFLAHLIYQGQYKKALAMINAGYFESNREINQTIGNNDIMYLNSLVHAIIHDRLDIVKAIYELHLNMNLVTELYFAYIANVSMYNLYELAAQYGSDELIDYMLRKFPIYRSQPGEGAAAMAVKYRRYPMLDHLLSKSSDVPSVYNSKNFVGIMRRITSTDDDFFSTVNMKDEKLMEIAIDNNDNDMVMFLLDHYYPKDDNDVKYAQDHGKRKIAELLEEYNPDLKEPDMY